MNFAEQLKKTRDDAIQLQNATPIEKVKPIIDKWYDYLKRGCMSIAEQGGQFYRANLREYIFGLDESYTSKTEKRENSESDKTEYFISFPYYSSESKEWEDCRSLFFHYWYGEAIMRNNALYHYPHIFGLDIELAEQIRDYLSEKCADDGLNGVIKLHDGSKVYRLEERYVEYGKIERMFTGKGGYYKTVPVEEKKLRELLIEFRW